MPPSPDDVPSRAHDPGPPRRAWIVFGHGSSDPDWAGPLRGIAHRLSARLGEDRVALAFLERQPPSLEQAAAALVDRGATHVTVAPMFLGVGGHLKRDLPTMVDALRARWPRVRFEMSAPIGESPRVADAIVESIAESFAVSIPGPVAEASPRPAP